MSTTKQFASRYPQLYHMAEHGSWPSIQRHGLLSTTALLDLFQIDGQGRFKIESQWRPASVTINHPSLGVAVVRDQKPMPPESLRKVLESVTPQEWYEFLNRKSFFWVNKQRLRRFLSASAYRNNLHDVIVVDTQAFLERHLKDITLSPINSGVSAFGPPYKRGLHTFQQMSEFPVDKEAVELAVRVPRS